MSAVDFNEIVLHKLKVASRQYLSGQMAHDARAEVYVDAMTDRVAAQLSSHVMTHRLLRDDQSASFSEDVVIEQPAPRFLVIPQTVLFLATGAVGLATGSLVLIAFAWALAAVSIYAYTENPPRAHTRTVAATVTIPVTSYATFPENTITYPRELGSMVALMEPEAPYWKADPS